MTTLYDTSTEVDTAEAERLARKGLSWWRADSRCSACQHPRAANGMSARAGWSSRASA